MKRLCKRTGAVLCALIIAATLITPALAAVDVPYDAYTYNYREYIEYTPAPYIPAGTVSGLSLGIGAFRNPQAMCVAPDGKIYVADTDNNRVVIISADLTSVVAVVDSFDNDGAAETFGKPYGVAVSDIGRLYIADSENKRVVVLEPDGTLYQIIRDPKSEMLPEDYEFTPLKVAVDYAGRVYVIAKNMFQGIMVFDEEGTFQSFFGTIAVKISLWQRIWRSLSTKEQRARQTLYIPTEFTGVDVDEEGFVYASCIDPDGKQAAFRLNPKGQDVIKKGENGNVGGDIYYYYFGRLYDGASYIVDIIIRDKGIYSMLDSRRGRIFTYDNEGNLLYIFGGLGTQTGTFKSPSALAATGNKLLVLDSDRQEILAFEETDYGRLINEAVGLRYDGDERLAVDLWKQVLTLNENLELANVGIGKAYLTEGNNKDAMKHLKLGMNRTYYSVAFKRYRNELLKDNLSTILTVAVILLLILYIKSQFFGKKSKKGDLLADD